MWTKCRGAEAYRLENRLYGSILIGIKRSVCLSVLATILNDNWEWRGQIWRLALFELKKQSRGAALGWAWFLIQPIMYIFCFWFAIEIGLRGSRTVSGDAPFILWLSAGIVPWFFMRSMLNGGANVLTKYSHLVKKIKFPLSAISSMYEVSAMLIQLMSQIIVVAVYFGCGQGLDLYLLQVPLLLVAMYGFWYFFSLLISPLCAISKDIKNLVATLTTPFFWLSGVLFNVKGVESEIIQTVLYYNPITFFVTGFRAAIYDKVWIWEDPMLLAGFLVVFAATAALALVVYKKTNEVVADVI